MESTEVREKFTGIEKTVIVQPIKRLRSNMVDSLDHEAAFLFGNSTLKYCLPVDLQGNLVNPFSSKKEQEWLEKELDLDLNFHRIKDNYWKSDRAKVVLGKESIKLNLENPKHYLDYLILRANSLFIAPSLEEQFKKRTYRYVFTDEESESKQVVKKADLEIEAYMALGKLRDSREDMLNFLKIYGKKLSAQTKTDFLFKEVKKIVETDLDGFLTIIRDKDNYELRLLLSEAVEAGIINLKGRQYFLPGGDPLCNPGEVATLDVAMRYLKAPINEEIYISIKTRLDNAKD